MQRFLRRFWRQTPYFHCFTIIPFCWKGFKLNNFKPPSHNDTLYQDMLRGMCGHLVHLRIKCKHSLNQLIFAQNWPKLFLKDKTAIYIWDVTCCLYANYAYKKEQCLFYSVTTAVELRWCRLILKIKKSLKFEKGSLVSFLHPFV